jgi:hypothetical protein
MRRIRDEEWPDAPRMSYRGLGYALLIMSPIYLAILWLVLR